MPETPEMQHALKSGDLIKCKISNSNLKVIEYLGEGGQGEVYRVEYCGKQKALKWYKPNCMGKKPQSFYNNISDNISKGPPNAKVFLWPEDITEWRDGVFGYVMPLRPKGFHEVTEYLLTLVRFKSYKAVADASLNIVNAFRLLHNRGSAYLDLNDGNFFINPNTGQVLICDNDNVVPEGDSTGIAGKPGYIAPEIVMGKLPDSYSDRWSMAIIIFMLFTLTRPLEGKRALGGQQRSQAFYEVIYGTDPHFIMEDIQHPEYGPDPIEQPNAVIVWNALPEYMRNLFLKAFNKKSADNPYARPTELEWIECLVRFRSELLECRCGSLVLTKDGQPQVCSRCGNRIDVPFKLHFKNKNYYLPGFSDTRIYRCQVGPCNANQALSPVGRVIVNKANTKQIGIRNLTDTFWNGETKSGKSKKVLSNSVVPLIPGIKLYIESEIITIEEN